MKIYLTAALMLLFATMSVAQIDSTKMLTYQRFPTVPPFKILLHDSTTYLSKDNLVKKKKVMIMLFSPDCEHCQHQTEQIIAHMKELEDIQIVMATTLPFEKVKEFYARYDLGRFKNLFMGKDANYMLPTFYGAQSLPYLAFYNKNWSLVSVFEGTMKMEDLLKEVAKD